MVFRQLASTQSFRFPVVIHLWVIYIKLLNCSELSLHYFIHGMPLLVGLKPKPNVLLWTISSRILKPDKTFL